MPCSHGLAGQTEPGAQRTWKSAYLRRCFEPKTIYWNCSRRVRQHEERTQVTAVHNATAACKPRREMHGLVKGYTLTWSHARQTSCSQLILTFSVHFIRCFIEGKHPLWGVSPSCNDSALSQVHDKETCHSKPLRVFHTLMWRGQRSVSQACLAQRRAHVGSFIRMIAENRLLHPASETPLDNCLLSELACYLRNC